MQISMCIMYIINSPRHIVKDIIQNRLKSKVSKIEFSF